MSVVCCCVCFCTISYCSVCVVIWFRSHEILLQLNEFLNKMPNLFAFMSLFASALLATAQDSGVERSPVRIVVIGGGAAGKHAFNRTL